MVSYLLIVIGSVTDLLVILYIIVKWRQSKLDKVTYISQCNTTAVQGGRTSKLFIHCSVRIFCLMCFRNSMISVGMKDQLMFLLFYMCNHCVFMKCWFVELVGGNLVMVILLFSEGRRLHF